MDRAVDTARRSAEQSRCSVGCLAHRPDDLLTWANLVTLVRTLGCVLLAMASLAGHGRGLLAAALLVHWIGDVADGLLARRFDQETPTGAVLDIVADRLCVAVVYVGFVVGSPEFAVALGVYLVEFMLVDAVLSLAFLRWPISGPNYFARVDRLVWRWNWWPPAKVANSAVPALVCVVLGSPTLALALAVALLVLKVGSLVRVVGMLQRRGEVCGALHG